MELTFRFAVEQSPPPLILDFIKELADCEHMLDQVVADKAALAAEPMSDWMVYRLTGDTLKNLAETSES